MAKKKRTGPARAGNAASPAAALPAAAAAPTAQAPSGGPASPTPQAGPSAQTTAQATASSRARATASAAAARVLALPGEVVRGDWTVLLLALMMFFAPAVGVPHEEMLQDTLKSIVVSMITLGAALIFFWRQRNRRDALRWHGIIWIFLLMMAYALGSMVWSHTYLAGVEGIRWFVLSVLMWLTFNTLTRDRLPTLALGIHFGAVVATLWAALQFWIDFTYFPQGPNPASTFVNRNFYAEFVACTLPFSLYLLLRAQKLPMIALLAVTLGFNLVGIHMTGTRSALWATYLTLGATGIGLWVFRAQLSARRWDSGQRIAAVGLLLVTFIGLGLIPSGNPKLLVRGEARNALEQGFLRAASIAEGQEYTTGSFSVRLVMWKATMRMIEARPLTGVGAGAWEVDQPLYQSEGSQLETDYYVHNEVLQLMAEYGLVGMIVLAWLVVYLIWATWKTWQLRRGDGPPEEGLIRVVALGALLAFMVVSNAGFPWRLASTGALFALALGILAASDCRLNLQGWVLGRRMNWRPAFSQTAAVTSMVCLALAAFITQRAAECESKIVRATKLALTISQSGDPNNPRWDKTKAEMLTLIKQGTDINPHYRKITPMVADELAKWGDWRNATWIWESVISSRPYVVAIMSNAARGHAQIGNLPRALELLERAKKIQPKAVSIRSLEVILLSRMGQEDKAYTLAKQSLADELFDFDMVNAAWVLAARRRDMDTVVRAFELRNKVWPGHAVDAYTRLGAIWLNDQKNEAKALEAWRRGLEAAKTPAEKDALRRSVPAPLQSKL